MGAGGRRGNPEKYCLQQHKSLNKVLPDMKRTK